MSEEQTQDMPEGRPFEERVFARLDNINARLQALGTQNERHALETKPIWEHALAEILEVKESIASVERKIEVMTLDVMKVRADQRHLEHRMDRLESKPAQ